MIRVFGVLCALRVLLLPHALCGQNYSTPVGMVTLGLPSGKESACQCRRCRRFSSVPGLGQSPGEGYGNSLQYSCWEIPWTEELGRLQSMGCQRVRHDWVINTQTQTRTQYHVCCIILCLKHKSNDMKCFGRETGGAIVARQLQRRVVSVVIILFPGHIL